MVMGGAVGVTVGGNVITGVGRAVGANVVGLGVGASVTTSSRVL